MYPTALYSLLPPPPPPRYSKRRKQNAKTTTRRVSAWVSFMNCSTSKSRWKVASRHQNQPPLLPSLSHSLSLSIPVSLAGTTISLLYGTSDVLLNLMNEFNFVRFFSCFAVYTIQIHKQSTHTDTHIQIHLHERKKGRKCAKKQTMPTFSLMRRSCCQEQKNKSSKANKKKRMNYSIPCNSE